MKNVSLLIAIMPLLAGQEAVPAKGAAPGTVYIVNRATTTESRALFSARLLNMSAIMLHWYEGGGVVRVQITPMAMETLRADRDVVLVLSETDSAALAGTSHETPAHPPAVLPPEQALTVPQVSAAMPMLQAGAPAQAACAGPALPQLPGAFPAGTPPPMPFGGMGVSAVAPYPGGGGGLGIGAGMGLVDSLAGGVAQRLLNRPPSCKISVAKSAVRFGAEGGEGLIEINASGSCAWQAQASVSWIKILSGTGVSGSGIVSYSVDPTGAKSRSGAIWISTSPSGSPIKGKASQVVTQTR